MKKRIKQMGALLLAAALCAGLAGCGGGGLTASDATVYVQGLMDRTYLGQYNQDYMDLVGVTEEEMEQNYEDGIQVEAEFFCYYFEIEDASEELMEEIRAFYRELYSHAVELEGFQSDEYDACWVYEPGGLAYCKHIAFYLKDGAVARIEIEDLRDARLLESATPEADAGA